MPDDCHATSGKFKFSDIQLEELHKLPSGQTLSIECVVPLLA